MPDLESFRINNRFVLYIITTLMLLAPLCSCSKSEKPIPQNTESEKLKWYKYEQEVFHGIPAKVTFALPQSKNSDALAAELINQVKQIYLQIDKTFNAYDQSSRLAKINSSPKNSKIKIFPDFKKAFDISQSIYTQSNGAFDPSIWPLKKLWSKAKKSNVLPGEKEIENARNMCGLNHLVVNNLTAHKKKAALMLDFGGLVKGYAVDKITSLLISRRVLNGLVQCGGEIRNFGKNNKGKHFKIGIQHPLVASKIYGYVSSKKTFAISTSGNYRQPILIGDKLYYHIFDPKSGQPVSTDVLGVSVIFKGEEFANAKADGWATALAVLGVEQGLKMAERYDFEVMFLKQDKTSTDGIKAIMSRGFKSVFTRTE